MKLNPLQGVMTVITINEKEEVGKYLSSLDPLQGVMTVITQNPIPLLLI